MAEIDYAAMVERAMETLRMLGRKPLAHQELQGLQMDRAQQQHDEILHKIRPLPLQDWQRTILHQPGTFQPPPDIYSGERGQWVRERE